MTRRANVLSRAGAAGQSLHPPTRVLSASRDQPERTAKTAIADSHNYSKSHGIAASPCFLEDALVLGRGTEVQIEWVTGQVHMYHVLGFDDQRAIALCAGALHLDVVLGDRDLQVLRLFENGLPNRIFGSGGVSALQRLSLDSVLELVIGKVGRNQLRAQIHCGNDNQDSNDEFDSTHNALRFAYAHYE